MDVNIGFKPGQRVKVIKTGRIGEVHSIMCCGKIRVKIRIPEGVLLSIYRSQEIILWTQDI